MWNERFQCVEMCQNERFQPVEICQNERFQRVEIYQTADISTNTEMSIDCLRDKKTFRQADRQICQQTKRQTDSQSMDILVFVDMSAVWYISTR